MNDTSENLRAAVERRARWFFEAQLRGLNIESFRGYGALRASNPDTPDPFYNGADGQPLDGLREWSKDELDQRGKFQSTLLGQNSDWLGFRTPRALLEKLRQFSDSLLSDALLRPEGDTTAPRQPRDKDEVELAVSRLEVTNDRPWLIPEVYGWTIPDFLNFDANELRDLYHIPGNVTPDAFKPQSRNVKKNIDVGFLADDNTHYQVRLTLPEAGKTKVEAASDPRWAKADYWLKALASPVLECYANKENSDMGLAHLIRVLYLYGTIPDHITPEQIRWRRRSFDAPTQQRFNDYLRDRVARSQGPVQLNLVVQTYTQLLRAVQLNAADLRTCDFRFSLFAEEVIKQALLRYKFWLDESFHCLGNDALNNFKKNYGRTCTDDGYSKYVDKELQYWSENHYILFASAEYLIGQLWRGEKFLPGRDFLSEKDRADPNNPAAMDGTKREQRGRWRVLKYLNNRLRFGWTEFNSSGYYREHIEALLNVADFALDAEVRRKAWMVLDLMFFDYGRFSHKGSFGVVGGRSQFKSKHSGWDTSVGDVIELAFGTRGTFTDQRSAVGMCLATSSYRPPEVLLEIGAHPPEAAFVDRSRVSISFEDAAKHGITYPDKTRQRDSQEQGYAPKLAKQAPQIARVNAGLAATHTNYGAYEDDLVFWWTTSAFLVKQTIEGGKTYTDRWGLGRTDPFTLLSKLYGDPGALAKDVGLAWVGGIAGSQVGMAFAGPIGGAVGAAAGAAGAAFEFGDPLLNAQTFAAWGKIALYGLSPILGPAGIPLAVAGLRNPFSTKQHADDLSILIEGSVRSRMNLYTYRDRDVMLSTVQVYRPGQLNFQSNLNIATLSTGLSAFPTTPFKGMELPDVFAGLGGGLVGGIAGSFALGAVAGVVVNEAVLKKKDLSGLVDHEDGPGWFTGYWANPMMVQHETAAILLCDFHWFQRTFASYGTHVFLPEEGLDEVNRDVEPNRDKFDDTEGVVEDVVGFVSETVSGKNGSWTFGRLRHSHDTQPGQPLEEAYLAVFSYEALDVLDSDFDFYKDQLADAQKDFEDLPGKIDDALDDLEHQSDVGYIGRQAIEIDVTRMVNGGADEQKVRDELAASKAEMIQKYLDKIICLAKLYIQQRDDPWRNGPLREYFANKDHYASGKNIFIIQTGSSAEFGSYDEFKRQVVDSTIKLEPHGDQKCSYEGPLRGGRRTLQLHYEDGGHAWVDGSDFAVDDYPRWQSSFVRGGKVEWLQPEYTIEFNGHSLTHRPKVAGDNARVEDASFGDNPLDRVVALAIYVKTENENLDIFSVGLADVVVGCRSVAADEIIAVGEIAENTQHDVEWIEFEAPVTLDPDMTIELKHPAVTHHSNAQPHWRMSFTLRALMADHTWSDCEVAVSESPIAEVTGSNLVADYGASQVREHTLQLNFEDEHRSSGAMSFRIKQDRWRPWARTNLPDATRIVVARPNPSAGRYPHTTLFGLNVHGRLMVSQFSHCADPIWERAGVDRIFEQDARFTCLEPRPDYVLAFAIFDQQLHVLRKTDAREWAGQVWEPIEVEIAPLFPPGLPPQPVPLADNSRVVAATGSFATDHVLLAVLGQDGQLYAGDWALGPFGSQSTWTAVGADAGMAISTSIFHTECNGFLLVVDDKGVLWAARLDALLSSQPAAWEAISPSLDVFKLPAHASVVGASVDSVLNKLFAVSDRGEVWTADFFDLTSPVQWEVLGDLGTDAGARVTCNSPMLHQLHVFSQRADGSLITKRWTHADGWLGAQALGAGAAPPLASDSKLWPVSRGQGKLEALVLARDQVLAWTWWS